MSSPYAMADRMTMSSPDLRSPKRPQTAPTRFMGPPSSPPPTSPLPLLPISPSPVNPVRLATPPPRLPRLQVSLPDLRPDLSSAPERIHKTVHFATTDKGRMSTSPSPLTKSIEMTNSVPRYGAASNTTLNESERDSPFRESAKYLRRSAGGQIWWAPSVVRTYSSPLAIADSQLDSSTPPLPPKSAKRRSKKPPQKAVARSALHIPSQLVFAQIGYDRQPQRTTPLLVESPFTLDEPVTSLPSIPSMIQNERRACYQAQASQPKEKDSDFGRLLRLSFTPVSYRKPGSRTSQSTAEDRVSFCAVTNLESSLEIKETASTTPLAAGADAVEQPVPAVWHRRHRRQIWIVVTILAILISAGGILAGIIWKLSRAVD